MRLLYVIDSLTTGGAETSLAEMAPGLVHSGIDLHVLSLGSRHDLAPRLEQVGVSVHQQEALRQGRLGNVRSVLDVARMLNPSLIHTTLYEADIAGRTASQLLGIPSTTSIVNDSYSPSHYHETGTLKLHAARSLDAATCVFAKRFHAITHAIAGSVSVRLGIPRRKIEVIARGRDPEAFPFRPEETRRRIREELGIDEGSPVILAIGRQEPQKGLHHLLNALPIVAAETPNVVILFAGKEGRSSNTLRAQSCKFDHNVHFLGHRSDVADLLAAADIFCFPSEREGFGGALIEAMAVGCPVVASDIPTTREVLGGPSPVGILTPVGDESNLASALHDAIRSPEARLALAHRARRRFDDQFRLESVTAQMVNFFDCATR